MSTWPACETCGGEIGEHLGQCPAGAGALFDETLDTGRSAGLAPQWRDNLRLELVDARPGADQPSLFDEV